MNIRWLFTTFAICSSLLVFSPITSAQSMDYGYNSDDHGYSNNNDDFTLGYRQGYDHGFSDRRAGLNFDYEHSEAYQMGSYDFQSGYRQGYSDAYSRRPSQMTEQSHKAVVEVFEGSGFRGNKMSLGIGNYASIDLGDVQSLRINGDVRVILFNEPNFDGRSITLTDDAPSLRFMQSGPFWTFGLTRHHTGSMIIEPIR